MEMILEMLFVIQKKYIFKLILYDTLVMGNNYYETIKKKNK